MQRVVSGGSRERGFTLIELLIVVAIIGIIAAIAIPNMYAALQTTRGKRTMADMRTIANGLQAYAIDNGVFPMIGETEVGDLQPYLANSLKLVPPVDAWLSPMLYQPDADGSLFTLISFGSNKLADTPYTYGFTHRHKDDIVYNTAIFIQWPDGVQHLN